MPTLKSYGYKKEEVVAGLQARGASDDAVADIVRSLFTGSTSVDADLFARRAGRLRDGLQLDLLGQRSITR